MSAAKLIELAAWFHLFQVPGTWYLARRVVRLRDEVQRLAPLARAIVAVLGVSVVVVLVTLGVCIGVHPEEALKAGLGLWLCGFLGLFWFARLLVQIGYFHALPWPRSTEGRLAHAGLCGIFLVQTIGYLGGIAVAGFQ